MRTRSDSVSNAELTTAPLAVSAIPSPGLLERKIFFCLDCPRLHQESHSFEREMTEVIQGFSSQSKMGHNWKWSVVERLGNAYFFD